MENLESGKDKIKKICDILRDETLEPARHEAKKITANAEKEAAIIVDGAKKRAEEILKSAKEDREKERALFEGALMQAGKQSIAALKQEIEENLFSKELGAWIEKTTADPKASAELIAALVTAIEKEGISTDFSATVSKAITPEKVNGLIAESVLKKLREKGVVLGAFSGGVRITLHDKKIALDASDEAIKDLLAKYTRKEFRKILFNS